MSAPGECLYSYGPSGVELEAFRGAYVECALWVAGASDDDLPADDRETLEREARDWLEDEHAQRLIMAAIWRGRRDGIAYSWESAGHDVYLTRERHGAGFWDRGLGIVGDALTALAHAAGSSDYLPPYCIAGCGELATDGMSTCEHCRGSD